MSNKYEGILVSYNGVALKVFLFLKDHKPSKEGAAEKAIRFAEAINNDRSFPVNLPEDWKETVQLEMRDFSCIKEVSFVKGMLKFTKVDVN